MNAPESVESRQEWRRRVLADNRGNTTCTLMAARILVSDPLHAAITDVLALDRHNCRCSPVDYRATRWSGKGAILACAPNRWTFNEAELIFSANAPTVWGNQFTSHEQLLECFDNAITDSEEREHATRNL